MKERVGQREQKPQIPLFDAIPTQLQDKETSIITAFDGSFGTLGITMVLNPATGDVVLARLTDMLSGKIVRYEPLARGKWTNPGGDLKQGESLYAKLETVYEDVYKKYEEWKFNPKRRSFPVREWTNSNIKNLKPWTINLITSNQPIQSQEKTIEQTNTVHNTPLRKRYRGLSTLHPAIIHSKETPKLGGKAKSVKRAVRSPQKVSKR